MIDVVEITIEEFKGKIYSQYIKLFPDIEQRDWDKIELTYAKGIEHFYKIILNNKIIGFFMLERINEDYPYYLDYFGIYEEYQNKGYGTKAIKKLINEIDERLLAEIEKENNEDLITIKRFEFYRRLGFEKIESEYLLYNVTYVPIVYSKYKEYNKEKYDKLFFDYYTINCGEEAVKENCKIIK